MQKLKRNKKAIVLGLGLLIPLSLMGGIGLVSSRTAGAEGEGILNYYSENVSVTNGNFTNGANPYASGELQGWSIIEKESKANGMIIDVEENYSNNHENVYRLAENPKAIGDDNKILMINSRYDAQESQASARKGYRSNTITLKANSYYKLSLKALTALNGGSSVKGSIYVSGLKNSEGNDVSFAFEGIENKSWQNYYFYLVTGDSEQEITIDLYLGSKNSSSYGGVVFYDDVCLERFSQNYFYKNIDDMQGSFDYVNGQKVEKQVKYLLTELTSEGSRLDMSGYNFDFEDINPSQSALGDSWKRVGEGVNASYGHAMIFDVGEGTQPVQFKEKTGYDFAGNTLSLNNKKALVMYTQAGQTAHFAVTSKDIEIKAHGIYRLSTFVKTTEMNGGFYVKVKENDKIFDAGLSSESYKLMEGSSSAISSSGSDKFTNGYQRVDFYIKGHQLFDTSVNLQFVFGSSDASASGCVFVDDITLSYVTYEEFKNGSNTLELTTISSEPTFKNGFFNNTENDKVELKYPLKAENWTLEQNDNKMAVQEAGVVYLQNRNKFLEMYGDEDWGKVYPSHPSGQDYPNNAFMFYSKNGYQNLTSESYAFEKNSFYKLTFDFWTQSFGAENSYLTIEIVDEDGILLFKQGGYSSETTWKQGEIYFRTAESSANSIKVKIHFGENENNKRMSGAAYIDNFKISTDVTEEVFEGAKNKVDMTSYYLNLDPTNTIGAALTDSTAYSFAIDHTYIETNAVSAKGGIVSGKENEYGLEVEDANILVLTSMLNSKSSLKSNFKLDTEASNYYKMTFELRTMLENGDLGGKTDKHDCKFGASVGLSEFKLAEGLVSEDKFTKYTIYFKADNSKTPQFVFSLNSDCDASIGSAFLTHLTFTSATEDEYTRAKDGEEYGKTVFASVEENVDEDATQPDDNDTTAGENDNLRWLLIPSLIFGAAIVIAIVGYALRKIKIKKSEKVVEEDYNRKISVDHDLVLRQAQAERDEEVASLKETKANLLKQKEEAEESHKEAVKEARISSKGKITKDTEREFKAYASKIARLQEKLDILDEQIDAALSTDHLMDIEKRISDDEIRRQKELRKASKSDSKSDSKSKQ